jgi:hypothetical protein
MTTSCVKPETEPNLPNGSGQLNTDAIEFSDYSLTTCHWNINSLITDSVYIVNSQEEFLMLISCEEDMPSIDFTDQTLLFVYGKTLTAIESKMISLEASNMNYIFNLTIQCNDATIVDKYFVAVIVSGKITSDTAILFHKIINN